MRNRTYENCKLIIEQGGYDYEDMYETLDLFKARNRITSAEYVELTGMLVEPAVEEVPIENL